MSAAPDTSELTQLEVGQPIPFGGDRVTTVPAELAERFAAGDRLIVVQATGALLHVPAAVADVVDASVAAATEAFAELARCDDDQISAFFTNFAERLDDESVVSAIVEANRLDVESATARGRSTTRLLLDDAMRRGMIAGLDSWSASPSRRSDEVGHIDHDGWEVFAHRAPLGVVGFVFEGRPNVFADACGVLRTGNTVVFRIGSDALGTARAIIEHAVTPALAAAGMPAGAVQLVDSPTHAAGHALFADPRLGLAVARGSGAAVAELGAVATQSGIPVSLHGTGGAWMIAGASADPATLRLAVEHSLDRKVCNTLNVCAVPADRAAELVPVVLDGLDAAARNRGAAPRLHVVNGSERWVPSAWFDRQVPIERADGVHQEPAASSLDRDGLAIEWEWEQSPEMTLVVVDDLAQAVTLCNRYSPRFVASLIADDEHEQLDFYDAVDAPFVGDGFTRWVDGQYALDAPELGLSNWQGGRMLGRGAILSGDSVHTVRYRSRIADHSTHR